MTHDLHITTTSFLKNLGYIPAIFVGLSLESYAILAVLMVIDTLFGITRVAVIYGGRHIKSYKLIAGLLSKLTVLTIPLLMVWAGRGAGLDLLFVAQGTLGVLVLAEFYSILGSVYAIRVRRDVAEFDAVAAVIRTVQRLIENIIKKDPSSQPTSPDIIDQGNDARLRTACRHKEELDTDKPNT